MDEIPDPSDEEPGPIARMPTDELMHSEVAILTGGRDQQGHQLITLPAKHHGTLESKVKATGLGRILRYFMESSRASDKRRGFGYVVDMRFANIDFVSMLKSTLSSLQAEMRDSVAVCVLYGIQPINKKTCKDALTMLNLRKSKKKQNKHIAPPLFQVVMAADEMDLYNFIDRSHLTPDLGGYLQYSHTAWLRFRKAVESFFINYKSLEARLPIGYERLLTLSHQRTQGNSKEELLQFLHWLNEQYEEIRSEINIEPVSDMCDSLQARFEHSENDPVFGPVAQKPIFRETKSMVIHCHRELTAAEKRIEALWEGASSKVQQMIDLISFGEQAKQLHDWFAQKGCKELKRRFEIADSLSRAEMLCNHFDTGLYSKGKAKLAQADGLIQHAETMIIEQNNANIVGILNTTKLLKQQTKEFRTALNMRKMLIQKVYDFFSVYEKAAKWVTRVLKFLPDNLIDIFSDLQGKKHQDHAMNGRQYQWRDDVKRFLRRYPPPNREELAKARKAAEVIPENKAKKQGRVLVHRCLVLLRILSLKEVASMRDVVEAFKWQESLLSDNTDGSMAGDKKQKQATVPSDSSWTSHEGGDASRSQSTSSKGKTNGSSSKRDVGASGGRTQKKFANKRPERTPEHLATNGYDEPDHSQNRPARELYAQSPSPGGSQGPGFMQRPVYLPGGSGQEVHTVPSPGTVPSHARLNGGIPQQDLHNQSFGIYGESDHDGGHGYNGPSAFALGDVPQGLPANQLPGNRFSNRQDYSLFPQQKIPGEPSTSSPNSHYLSPSGVLSREPSPIRSPDISSTQQSPPLRPYKSMFDVRREEELVSSRNFPPNFESHIGQRTLGPSSRPVTTDSAWMTTLPGLHHGKSEPELHQSQHNRMTSPHNQMSSPYNDILHNLSALRLQNDGNYESMSNSGNDPENPSQQLRTDEPNPQEDYYQRLFGTDGSNLGHLASNHFHDKSPYDISIERMSQEMQKQKQRRRPNTRYMMPPPKIQQQKPPSKFYIDERTPPELLNHAGALPSMTILERMPPELLDHAGALPTMTPLDVLEYELAADQDYLAEEIADDKYRMEKEHQAMIESLFVEADDQCQDNLRRLYDLGDIHRPKSSTDHTDFDMSDKSHNPTNISSSQSRSRNHLTSPPGTPPLPEILSSPSSEKVDESWNFIARGAHEPLTMRELSDLDDNRVRQEGSSLAPVTDRLKEYFEDKESSQPLEYEKLLEEAQRNREESQETLRREMDRFNDVLMHREELVQQDLQDRLYKLEEKLQEEAAILKQEHELDYLMQIERRRDHGSHKHDLSPYDPRRDINLQLSDEGVIFDGGSVDEGYEHASTITTERESVESGLGMRRSRRSGSQIGSREKPERKTVSTLEPRHHSTISNRQKQSIDLNGHADQLRGESTS